MQKHQYIPIDFLLIAKSFLDTPTIKSEDVDLQKNVREKLMRVKLAII